jgi:hypothetical protein
MGKRSFVRTLSGTLLALALGVAPVFAQYGPPPEKGGVTYALKMPPVYKGYAGFDLQFYRPGQADRLGTFANFGLLRDFGSPVVGLAAAEIQGYAGFLGGEGFEGGARLLLGSPTLGLAGGVDYFSAEESFDFILSLRIPTRRTGIFGQGSDLSLYWLPGRHNTLGAAVHVPLWGRNMGKTRPRHDNVKLIARDPVRLDPPTREESCRAALAEVRERAHWITRLCMPFAEKGGKDARKAMAPDVALLQAHIDSVDSRFPDGHTYEEEIRVYHEELDRAFSIAASGEPLAAGQSTPLGRMISAKARAVVMDEVLIPYDRLLGQRKTNDNLAGLSAVAHTVFTTWLLSATDIPDARTREVYFVLQTLTDIIEENRAELRERWKDSRFVWLPLQYALKPEEHDTHVEMDGILERVIGARFAEGTDVWYVINEQFQWEMARSVRQAEDYHALWIHDFRGKNSQGKPDTLAFYHTLNYLKALTERVRAYDETGKIPQYFLFLDQHYFEINNSRLWLRVLLAPLDEKIRLPSGYQNWEEEISAYQDTLQRAVEASQLLRLETTQYGPEWLRNRIRVQVNITNPADPSFFSTHVVGFFPIPDNLMRDHRKIAFYDVTEEDPYRGMAMFTGMGIGEHYTGPNWEDRAVMLQGPGALAVKDAARQLLLNQGFEPDEIPYSLRARPRSASYDSVVIARMSEFPPWLDQRGEVMQLHNETGFNDKPINVSKAVHYTLMPRGSVLKVPDSLWQSYVYASMLAGSALRGCKALVIAPALESAPSSSGQTMARAHDLMARLVVFQSEMSEQLASAGGLLKVGLYAPRVGVGDLAGRLQQGMSVHLDWSNQIYGFNPLVDTAINDVAAHLDSIGYRAAYLSAGGDSLAKPKLHLKANFFASPTGWYRLVGRPEWAAVLREYILYIAKQSTGKQDRPDVRKAPPELIAALERLLKNFHDDLSPGERERLIHYFTIGSTNMDYRSMVMDGEVQIILAGKQALIGIMDFLIIAGLCEWVETPEEIEELLPAPSSINRTIAGWMKLAL